MGVDRDRPSQGEPVTRRSFLGSSSALFTGVAIAGALSQQACSGSADAHTPLSASQTPPPAGSTDTSGAVDLQMRCWLEASDLVTNGLANGAAVTQWSDRTDSGYSLQYQPTIPDINGVWSHNAPVLALNAVNGLPAVAFDATQNHSLIFAPGGSLDQGVEGFTAIFVCCPDTTLLFDASYLFITHTADQSSRLAIILDPNQKGVRAVIRTGGSAFNLPALGGTSETIAFGAYSAPLWAVLVLRVQYSGSSPTATLQVNGTSVSIRLAGATVPTTPSYMNALCSTSEINHLTCQIAEAQFYPGYMSDSQLAQIMGGLQQKYALPA